MDSQSDDDIELLKQTPGQESHENSAIGFSSIDSHVNPLDLIKRGSSVDDSIDPASVHALQTAFITLQKKHNEEVRQKKELQHANKLMKKALMNATQGQGQFQNMEDYAHDPSIVHAAGGTSEDESLAESRAQQGFVQHLRRELLIANNTIQNGNDEITRLKHLNEELEREVMRHLRNDEEVRSEVDSIREILDQTKEENARKDLEINQMKNAVQSEQELNHNLRLKKDSLQEQIQASQRISVPGQNEIQTLKSKLENLERERQKWVLQYQELNRRLIESEKQVGILEAQCKQYEIEVNINRQQRNEKTEETDDVDGDVAALEKALHLIGSHRREVTDLKDRISEQQHIITKIQNTGKRLPGKQFDSSLFRPEAQGMSFVPQCEERPIYANYQNPGAHQDTQSRHSPLSRRTSDRGDYRGMEARTSPRVNDNILPTGNQNITPMLAMETNPQPKRMEIVGTIDPGSRTRSPGENTVDSSRFGNMTSSPQGNLFSRTSGAATQPNYAQQSPRNTISPRQVNNESYGMASEESPRTREGRGSSSISDGHALVQANRFDSTYIHTGARPRVPTSSSNYSKQYSNAQEVTSPREGRNQIPDRMTQSEIISRDRHTDGNAMTRSVLEPLQQLEILSSNTQENDYVHAEMEGVGQRVLQQNASERIYENRQYRQPYNGPDYENIYNANAETEIKRPIEEHDDTVFVTANQREFENLSSPVQQETGDGNVLSVKICPVCSEEFSRLTLDQFQMHVFECFDNCDESPATLRPITGGAANDDDRHCPMCGDVFPITIPQETYEQHVLAHFGEDPLVERFELLQP